MHNVAPSVSIIIPAYNEAGRIGQTLRTIGEYARSTSLALELIVVDDGSCDGTVQVAERHLPSAPNVQSRVICGDRNRGKGYAVRQGLLAARAPIALFSDADLSTPIAEMGKLIDA